jgi:TRAP-type C4-dicarboxylate transport system permease small subunit
VTLQGWAFGTALVTIVFVSLVNVFMRYVLTASIAWADEVARLLFIVVSFLGAGLAVAFRAHLVVDTLVAQSDPRSFLGRAWRGLIVLTSVTFFLALIVGGADQAARNFGQASPALRIPLGYVYLAVPVGAGIMLINYIAALLFGPSTLPATEDEPPASPEEVSGGPTVA